MTGSGLFVSIAIAYLGVLFGIAYLAERRADRPRSLGKSAWVYSLSIAVYCTAWTFYGSVGRAAESGFSFLPIYLGPTILAPLWIILLRKIIIISKAQRLTSLSDFISSRYGKSAWLGVLATLIAILGVIPYISIQLKAIVLTYKTFSPVGTAVTGSDLPFYTDTALYVAILLAVFAIVFGTRYLDPNQRHEGLVVAIAAESLLKLVAFLAVGVFVCWGLFSGMGEVFERGLGLAQVGELFTFSGSGIDGWEWFWLSILSMGAIMFLPRQFHVSVVENYHHRQVDTAAYALPLYMLLINLFVLPIAVSGLVLFGDSVEPDIFVLELPLRYGQEALAMLVGLGGFSAATGMVVVATLSLSIMIGNNMVLPFLLRPGILRWPSRDLPASLLGIRRLSIVVVLLLAYGYYRMVGESYSIVSTGLISFAAVAQFGPTVIAGLYWKGANRWGAYAGLLSGLLIWGYTLPLPTLIETGIWPSSLMTEGPWGIEWLRPYHLFDMQTSSPISHSAFWSLLVNTLMLVGVSLVTPASAIDLSQADYFVNIYKHRTAEVGEYEVRRRQARINDLVLLLHRFLGTFRAERVLAAYAARNRVTLSPDQLGSYDLINYVETHLAGAIGAASAKVLLDSITKEEPVSIQEMLAILDQTQEVLRYSRALEAKSLEIEQTTRQLRRANDQLQVLDRLKAEFITTVSHELRTPLTAIKSLSELLLDKHESMDQDKRLEFLQIIVQECGRLTRLINNVLDLERIQAQPGREAYQAVDLNASLRRVARTFEPLVEGQQLDLQLHLPTQPICVHGHQDRLDQVWINLIANAAKFCAPEQGQITVSLRQLPAHEVAVSVEDNGIGIAPENQRLIFEKFTQVSDQERGKPKGSGLGLHICHTIVQQHGGRITLNSSVGRGTIFTVHLPWQSDKRVSGDQATSINS